MKIRALVALIVLMFLTGVVRRRAVGPRGPEGEFSNPESVTIRGYSGDAMEPFVTRDGRFLLFNDSNAPGRDTNLHFAEKIDDVTFEYRGTIAGINSAALDGVATADRSNTIYFVSLRSYEQTLSSIYRGTFDSGTVRDATLVSGISKNIPGAISFDVEVNADGDTLILSDGVFTGGAVPQSADLAMAVRDGAGFRRVSTNVFANINTSALEYAACLSASELELFFTRLTGTNVAIYRSVRDRSSAPWPPAVRVAAINGFAEAPALSVDGRSLYYHASRNSRFVIERLSR